MRGLLALCVAALALTVAATAQDIPLVAESSNSTSAAAAPQARSSVSVFPWQVAMSYEYARIRPNSSGSFSQNGLSTTVIRFVSPWLGLEGNVAATFGHISNNVVFGPLPPNQNLVAKMVFGGGGLRIVYRSSARIEPWSHGLVGGAHFRFTQTAAPNTANALAYVVGGGVDYKMSPRAAARAQFDYLGTRFFSSTQNNFQVKGGIVFNF